MLVSPLLSLRQPRSLFMHSTFTFAKRANEKLDGSTVLRQHLTTAPSAIAVTSPTAAILSFGRYTYGHG